VDVAALRALVLTAWAERDVQRAENERLADQNDSLRHLIRQLQRLRFGRSSEKLDPDQLNLALEDLEQAVAAVETEQEKADPALRKARAEKRRADRGSLPEHLPRVEIVIEPEGTACPYCGGAMHVIGEDRSQRLDVIPAQHRVIVTRRPKYACRACGGGSPGAGAGPADRRWTADRAAGRPCHRRQMRRPLSVVPPGADPGAAGHCNRSRDPGVLDRL
jgi:transposase